MNRNLLLTGIICFALSAVFICFWILNNFIHGVEFNEFTAYSDLVVVEWIVLIFYEIIFLKYFQSKKYKAAFVTSLISAITFMVVYASVFTFFKGVGSGAFINLFFTIHLIAAITFSLSLVFSKASERPILKYTGVLSAVVGFIVLSTHVYGLNLAEGATLNMVLEIQLWSSRFGDALILILFALNFYQELKQEQGLAFTV
ncbi:hypothetical protein [Ekhidna sp.]|uniref:hypothetical protein n=1 Tax=Ekhidna sp. TaxID=2608089 RepID=UPI003CCC43CA